MILFCKTFRKKKIEIDLCFQKRCVALPILINWFVFGTIFRSKWPGINIDVHFLCFSLHFEYINWEKSSGPKIF